MPIIKVRHSETNEMRRLTVPDWPSLESLDRHLRVLFRDELPNPYALRYTDPDGDTISIYSNLELAEAQRSSGSSGTLLLVVSPGTAGESGSFTRLPPLRSSMLSSFSSGFSGFVSPPSGASSSSSPVLSSHALYPFGPSSTPLRQTLEGAALPPLKIVEWAPAEFVTGLQFLIAGGNHPEKSRDVLIDFGGIVDEAFKAISTSPAAFASIPGAPAIDTLNFGPAFTRAVAALEEDGVERRQAVAALIRNGGVLQNAKLEVAGSRATHRCVNGHDMGISSYNMGNYATGWFCDRCKKRGTPGQRWKCVDSCEYDVCFDCLPAPPTPAPKEVEAPAVSDNSLPPVLLIPVRQLEAMGFTDRMRIIELIVQHSGDITQAACQLADERRNQESHAAEEAAREAAREAAERLRVEQEAEAARRREEEDRQTALFEENRKKAAELAAAHPEKIGADISYLSALGFDPISSMTSLFNHAGNLEQAIEDLLKRHQQ